MSKHTIAIFEKIYNNLPPLVPDEIKQEMEHALDHLRNDFDLSMEEVEDTMIVFGKKVWPYWKAFGEFLDAFEGKLGEKFLLGRVSMPLKTKYKQFKEHGGDYFAVYSGDPSSFFTAEERQALSIALVEVDQDVRNHAVQSVLSSDRRKYEDLVVDFQNILDDILKRLESLRMVADDEQEHPQLAEEMRAQIRSFEFGLCLLGPHTKSEDVCNAKNYFAERKRHKVLHR